jgi:hypothetical protein
VVSFAPQGAPDGGPVVEHVHGGVSVNEISKQHWQLARTLALGLGCGDLWRAQPAPVRLNGRAVAAHQHGAGLTR